MKVLIVSSLNSGQINPFIKEQVNSVKDLGVDFYYFSITGKGHVGYLTNILDLYKTIDKINPDLIHAHYGLSGLLSCFQFKRPSIITFHGSDINNKKNRKYSYLASRLTTECIFVHKKQPKKINYKKAEVNIIPCGVNTDKFFPVEKLKARTKLELLPEKKYALFSSSFNNDVKNYPLAKEAISSSNKDITLIELKGYCPTEVNLLMNAVDFLLVTSKSETGPLVVKEAMACNTPVVSTDVGDVKGLFDNLNGYFITSNDPRIIGKKMENVIKYYAINNQINGRDRIIDLGLDSKTIARRVLKVYEETIRS